MKKVENIVLFTTSVLVYTVAYFTVGIFYFRTLLTVRKILKIMFIFALLCLPLNINGHVLTIAGNAVGEQGVFSLFSFYQKAENGAAVSILSIFNSQIAKRDALSVIGFPAYQKSGYTSTVVIGGSLIQKAKKESSILLGASIVQKAEITNLLCGVALRQNAKKEARIGAGLVFLQKVDKKERAFAFFSALTK